MNRPRSPSCLEGGGGGGGGKKTMPSSRIISALQHHKVYKYMRIYTLYGAACEMQHKMRKQFFHSAHRGGLFWKDNSAGSALPQAKHIPILLATPRGVANINLIRGMHRGFCTSVLFIIQSVHYRRFYSIPYQEFCRPGESLQQS